MTHEPYKVHVVKATMIGGPGDLQDRYIAEQRLIDLKAGRSASTSLGNVLNRYGMEDRA
jgi:hypothetical protein